MSNSSPYQGMEFTLGSQASYSLGLIYLTRLFWGGQEERKIDLELIEEIINVNN